MNTYEERFSWKSFFQPTGREAYNPGSRENTGIMLPSTSEGVL
jgi:hypothetical protein